MSFSNRNVVVTAFVCEDKHFFWIGQIYGWYYYPLFFFSHAGCKSTVISHFSYVILLQTQLKRWKIIFENWEGAFQRKFFLCFSLRRSFFLFISDSESESESESAIFAIDFIALLSFAIHLIALPSFLLLRQETVIGRDSSTWIPHNTCSLDDIGI